MAFKDMAEFLEIKEEDLDFERLSATSSISFVPSSFNGNGTVMDRHSEKSSITGRSGGFSTKNKPVANENINSLRYDKNKKTEKDEPIELKKIREAKSKESVRSQ